VRIVLDTNVLVSGMLNPSGAPGRLLDLILVGHHQVLYDDRILAEYEEVLSRPQLAIAADQIQAVLDYMRLSGERVTAIPQPERRLPDADDLPFLEVATSGSAEALVTGNAKHFPAGKRGGVKVMSPDAFLKFAA